MGSATESRLVKGPRRRRRRRGDNCGKVNLELILAHVASRVLPIFCVPTRRLPISTVSILMIHLCAVALDLEQVGKTVDWSVVRCLIAQSAHSELLIRFQVSFTPSRRSCRQTIDAQVPAWQADNDISISNDIKHS